jgi:hypothetical protein
MTITIYLVSYRFDVIGTFPIAKNGGETISVATGVANPKVRSTFNSLIPLWHRSATEFFVCVLPFKCYLTFSICMQNDLRKFWGRDILLEKVLINETPERHFSVANRVV